MRLAFFASRMIVVDEIKQRHKFMTLSFIEFVEALARVADSMNVREPALLLLLRLPLSLLLLLIPLILLRLPLPLLLLIPRLLLLLLLLPLILLLTASLPGADRRRPRRLGVRSVVDLDLVVLEGKVDLSFLREKHGSADVLAESERALVELDRFLFHLFGRLGLRDGGSIKTPGSTVSPARPRARRPRGSG